MHTPQPTRLYAYIDESGQDTLGRLFVVGAVVIDREQRDSIREQLEALEGRSRKGRVKWHRARHAYRQAYVSDLSNVTRLSGSIFLSRFARTRRYHEATAEATARAIRAKAEGTYRVRVGDRWTFVNVLPRSGFIQTVHHGKRTKEEGEQFVKASFKSLSVQSPPR